MAALVASRCGPLGRQVVPCTTALRPECPAVQLGRLGARQQCNRTGVHTLPTHRRARGAALLTTCMAAPKRVAMVAKQIEREVGNMLLTDKVLQSAVCPERKRGIDTYLSALASVTEVELSRDLQVAKVYISVYSDDEGKAKAFKELGKLEGYVRKSVGKHIRLRMTPEIRLIPDESFDRSQRVLSLLQQIKEGTNEPAGIAVPGDNEDDLEFIYEDLVDVDDEDGEQDEQSASDAAVANFLGAAPADDIDMFQSNKPSRLAKGGKRRGGGMRKKRGN